MGLWEGMNERARRLGILDTKLAQAAAIFLALIVVKLVPQILSVSVWWFTALVVVCAVKPLCTFLGRGTASGHARQMG